MTESIESHLAELHTQAAYAHAAAAHVHSTGDHASAQELARKALGYSAEALKHTEEMAQSARDPSRFSPHADGESSSERRSA
jgi:hypothetical protein